MKISIKQKFPIFFLISAIFMTIFAYTAFAADKNTVTFKYTLENAKFDVYKVGEIGENGVDLAEKYAKYRVDLNDTSAAQTLSEYITRDSLSPDITMVTDSAFIAKFDAENGVYLILGGSTVYNGTKYTALPVMVSVSGKDIEVDAKYEKKSDSSSDGDNKDKDSKSDTTSDTGRTKGGSSASVNRTSVSVSATKVWKGGSRPDSVTLQLLKDGKVYEEKVVNSDNNWRCSWEKLDKKSDWSVVEKEVPQGFEVSINRNGSTWVITNKSDTYDEEEREQTDEKTDEKTDEQDSDTPADENSGQESGDENDTDTQQGGHEDGTGLDEETGEDAAVDNTGSDSLERDGIDGGNVIGQVSPDKNGEGEKLPQTGQPWLPVIICAFLGIIFLGIGEYRKNR